MDDGDSWPGFTQAEEMETVYKEIGDASPRSSVKPLRPGLGGVACSFSTHRDARPATTWQQSWLGDKQKGSEAKFRSSSKALKLFVDLSGKSVPSNEPETSKKPKGNRVSELKELAFEARSSKDNAWYDVASFLTYRVKCAGELEVRVRFSGFSNTEDEWVNVKNGVRDRSIPLEPSECHKVKVGDLVLCYQERQDQAVYCDAHILDIERQEHDANGCQCIFLVCYDHDFTKEKVELGRLCCRPKH